MHKIHFASAGAPWILAHARITNGLLPRFWGIGLLRTWRGASQVVLLVFLPVVCSLKLLRYFATWQRAAAKAHWLPCVMLNVAVRCPCTWPEGPRAQASFTQKMFLTPTLSGCISYILLLHPSGHLVHEEKAVRGAPEIWQNQTSPSKATVSLGCKASHVVCFDLQLPYNLPFALRRVDRLSVFNLRIGVIVSSHVEALPFRGARQAHCDSRGLARSVLLSSAGLLCAGIIPTLNLFVAFCQGMSGL